MSAITLYERALALRPEFPRGRSGTLGLMYFQAGRWRDAADRLLESAALDPDDANVAEKLAIALAEIGEVDAAVVAV